jgi:hypothetical protein
MPYTNWLKKKGWNFSLIQLLNELCIPEKNAFGIVVNDENIYADVLVSNADIYFTYKNLLSHGNKAKKGFKTGAKQ